MAANCSFLARSILRQTCRQGLALSSAAPRLARAPFVLPRSAASSVRASHSIPRPPPRETYARTQASEENPEGSSSSKQPAAPWEDADVPTSEGERPPPKSAAYYQLSFTCAPCGHRSHHNVSKQAYHRGSTLITCPGCRNRHVISDHLNIFGDRKITVEDLMRERGQLVKRGSLGEDGDIEFWPEDYSEQQLEDSESTPSLSSPPSSSSSSP